MTVLIKQAKIVDSSSPFNGKQKDILIVDGIIKLIADSINDKADTVIEKKGLCVSIGWMDVFAQFGDPGFEYRETIESGANAAAAGGFTDVMLLPNTNPVVHNKSQIEYIVQKSNAVPVNIHPVGAVTKNAEGKELAEMYDMYQSGAVAFSDGTHSIQSPGLLLKALQYILPFSGTIIQLPEDKTISPHGLVNEGIVSTQLGLQGKPAIAEELMISRDIELAKYTASKIHITGVSTQKSIELIEAAKTAGIQVSCSVTPYHLAFCDEDLSEYDSNLKVNPPLRTRQDMLALRTALQKGTIDCIASHHTPHNYDSKFCEFEYAKNGMIGLETLFGVIGSSMNGGWTLEKMIDSLSVAPRKIFGFPIPELKEGVTATITLFNANETVVFEENMIQSKSKNTPFIGKTLKGKVIGIINGKSVYLN